MTEKRFTTNNGVFYTDNETGWEFQSYGEVVNLLNELNDENKIFREALKELKEIGDYQEVRIKELDDASKLLDGLTIPELLELTKQYEDLNIHFSKIKNIYVDEKGRLIGIDYND